MGKIKEFAEMDGYTETQLLMCEKEDLIEYIKYLRTITPEEEGEMLKHASVEDIQKDITTTRAAIEYEIMLMDEEMDVASCFVEGVEIDEEYLEQCVANLVECLE